MPSVQKDHTLEFPAVVIPKKPNVIVRFVKAITSGFIYSGDK